MPIKRFEDGSYEVRYDTYDATGNRHQRRKKFAKGQKKAADEFDAKHTLSKIDESKITAKDFLDGWLLHVKQHKKILTYDSYKQNVDMLYAALEKNFDKWKINLAKIKLSKITRSHMQAVIDWMISEGYGSGSVDCFRRVMSAAFTYAMSSNDSIQTNPLKGTTGGGAESKQHTVLDAKQVGILQKYLEGKDFYMPVFLASTLGLCRGEVGGLKWQDIDMDAGVLNINDNRLYSHEQGIYENSPKTKRRRRSLRLPKFALDELRSEKKRQLENQVLFGVHYFKSDYVCRQKDGTLYSPNTLSRDFPDIPPRAGLPRVTFHELRHSAASVLIANGAPIAVVSEILGHANTRVTAEVYIHALDNGKQEAADMLDNIYRPKTECGKNVANSGKTARKQRK